MPVLTDKLSENIREAILCLRVVDADYALFNPTLDTKVPQSQVFNLRAVGPVAGDVESRGVVNVHWYAVERRVESYFLQYIRAKH